LPGDAQSIGGRGEITAHYNQEPEGKSHLENADVQGRINHCIF